MMRDRSSPAGQQPPAPVAARLKHLVLVWAGLMTLLAATAGLSLVPLGAGNAILSVAIAIAKTALVALFFMHLRHSIPLLRVIAIVGVFTLSLLFILAGADFVTREIERSAWQAAWPSARPSPVASPGSLREGPSGSPNPP